MQLCLAFPVRLASEDPVEEVSVCSLAFHEALKPIMKKYKSGTVGAWNEKEVESLQLPVSSSRIVSFLLFQSVNSANS